ncbi:MAG: fatty acid desaturase [Thermoanaerobaculia bacterium]
MSSDVLVSGGALLSHSDAPAVSLHADARRQMMLGIETELAALRQLDTGIRIREMSLFIGLWVAGMLINAYGYRAAPGLLPTLVRIAGTVMTAVAINTFILFLHEGMHKTLFASPQLNRWVSVSLGVVFCLSFSAYKVMHQRHHQYLGDERDPDDYSNYTKNRLLLWFLHYVRLIAGVYIYIVMIPVLASRKGSPADRRDILVEYGVLAAVYAVVFTLVPGGYLLYLWFIPLVMAAHMTAIRGLTQHGITEAHDPYLASRSIQAHPVVAFCLLQENYHLEHHLFPEIPSYHLAEVHKLIWPRLPRVVTGRSYLAFLFKFFAATLRMDDRPIGFIEMIGWEV